jgi:hypothetical protein
VNWSEVILEILLVTEQGNGGENRARIELVSWCIVVGREDSCSLPCSRRSTTGLSAL